MPRPVQYVASAGRLIGAAIIAVILIIAGMLLTRLRRSSQAGILALAAGALFAYAWHAFIPPPAFDSASIIIVRVSNVVFAALALAAVSIAACRISDLSDSENAIAL